MKKVTDYFKSTIAELKQVTWPTRSSVVNYTLIVLGISAIVGILTGGFDFLFTRGLSYLITHF